LLPSRLDDDGPGRPVEGDTAIRIEGEEGKHEDEDSQYDPAPIPKNSVVPAPDIADLLLSRLNEKTV
jgi:hypothetical protein